MDIFKSATDFIGKKDLAKDQKQQAAKIEQQKWDAIKASDFDPTYASDLAPQFQRDTSPVARAYLESFLTGTNADAVQGTRAGAKDQKADAQQGFNNRYGTWDTLTNKQREIEQDVGRYAAKTPAPQSAEDATHEALQREAMSYGASPDVADELGKYSELERYLWGNGRVFAGLYGIDTSSPDAAMPALMKMYKEGKISGVPSGLDTQRPGGGK